MGIATVEVYIHHTAIFDFLKPENPKFPETPARETDVKKRAPADRRERASYSIA
ncbi:MAG: hypothetical protein IJY15_08270 [Thermoguttaceae bacterium]|nr:hypothetical protein [Thermoguttaceae bacterium]MBQ9127739.1 hypothetical protein [Thermoguttaceae bacterium]